MCRQAWLPILLLSCSLAACEWLEPIFYSSPKPVHGTVTIDGEPAPGITVRATDGGRVAEETTTANDGTYRFMLEPEQSYLLTLSGIPAGVQFGATTKSVVVRYRDSYRVVDFTGMRIRTSRVEGTVFLDGGPRAGITVELVEEDLSTTTSGLGRYVFTDLPMGTYTVEISGAPAGSVFDADSKTVTVGVQEVAVADFIGYREIGGISGRVGVRQGSTGIPLAGITVAARRLPADAILATTTDGEGHFEFTDVRLGPWLLEISGWSHDVIVFNEPTTSFQLTDQAPSTVQELWGRYRPGSVTGTVTLDGAPASRTVVRITDIDGAEHVTTTGGDGAYVVDGVAAGDATVALDPGDGWSCADHPRAVAVPPASTATADFSCESPPGPEPDPDPDPGPGPGPDPDPEPGPLVPLTFETEEADADGIVHPGTGFPVPVRDPHGAVVGEVAIETGPGGVYHLFPDRLYLEFPGSVTITPVGFSLAGYAQAVIETPQRSTINAFCVVQVTSLDGGGNAIGETTHSPVGETIAVALPVGTAALRIAFVQTGVRECVDTTLSIGGGTFIP